MRSFLLVLMLMAAGSSLADNAASTTADGPAATGDAPPAAVEGERSPGDMTVPERREMMAATSVYNQCVYEEAMTRGDAAEDIRVSADRALGQCQPRLDELVTLISGWGFPDYFAAGFSRTVRDHAARKILPELAGRQAN